MKKILFLFCLLFSFTAFGQVYENDFGITIQTVSQNGVAQVALPCGKVINLKAVINPSGNDRGRLTGDGVIMDVPILPATMTWDPSTQSNKPEGFYYNQAAGFTAYSATAYYVEGSKGPNNIMQYRVLQAQGEWATAPDPASWVLWYARQPQPLTGYYRKVSLVKAYPAVNQATFTIGL